jgi:hypothetical protein
MPISVGVGGAYKTMANLKVGVGSVWKQVAKVSVGVGGAWKDVWNYLTVSVANIDLFDSQMSPSNVACGIEVNPDGYIHYQTVYGGGYSGGQIWLDAGGPASAVECRLTQNSETGNAVLGGPALATWHNCGTARQWSYSDTTNAYSFSSFSGTLEFRDAATLAVVGSCTVGLVTEVAT